MPDDRFIVREQGSTGAFIVFDIDHDECCVFGFFSKEQAESCAMILNTYEKDSFI